MNRHERRAQAKAEQRQLGGAVDPLQLVARGIEYHKAGELERAEELYRLAVRANPRLAEPWHYLGAIAIGRGDAAKAAERYAHALELRPDWPEALNGSAHALHALERYDESIASFRRAVELDPAYAPCWNGLGIAVQRGGDLEAGHACFEKACASDPSSSAYVFNLGVNLKHQGRWNEARTAFDRALALRPHYPEALAQIGHCWRKEGRDAEAAEWYRRYLALATEDIAGAGLFLAARAGGAEAATPSAAYVRHLFDEYASGFEAHLRGELEYLVPEQMERALASWVEAHKGKLAILDLGCGTGLAGSRFHSRASRLVGVDLSPKMLAKARERGVYTELVEEEAVAHLERARATYDLILAADVFNYMGDLAPVLRATLTRLRAGGRLAFSVEAASEGVHLDRSLRFSHGEDYLRRILAETGFDIVLHEPNILRVESGQPAAGYLVVGAKPAAVMTA